MYNSWGELLAIFLGFGLVGLIGRGLTLLWLWGMANASLWMADAVSEPFAVAFAAVTMLPSAGALMRPVGKGEEK